MGRAGRADHTVTVERTIDAPPETIFEVLARPAQHQLGGRLWNVGGQRWRYQLVPGAGPDGEPWTLVIHSYDWGAAMLASALQLGGYPRRMAVSMPKSLQRLASVVTTG